MAKQKTCKRKGAQSLKAIMKNADAALDEDFDKLIEDSKNVKSVGDSKDSCTTSDVTSFG